MFPLLLLLQIQIWMMFLLLLFPLPVHPTLSTLHAHLPFLYLQTIKMNSRRMTILDPLLLFLLLKPSILLPTPHQRELYPNQISNFLQLPFLLFLNPLNYLFPNKHPITLKVISPLHLLLQVMFKKCLVSEQDQTNLDKPFMVNLFYFYYFNLSYF